MSDGEITSCLKHFLVYLFVMCMLQPVGHGMAMWYVIADPVFKALWFGCD